ncbi:dynactin subunit 5-like [Zophobas morio]|uniref:dynactin subunit 5-like n=1 Tax=Zophobas morio TaxID=2755281 RepID=UPI003083D64F
MLSAVNLFCVVARTSSLQGIISEDSILRGDLSSIKIGRYCRIGQGTVIRPPYKRFKKGVAFSPLVIGDFVTIEDGCVIQASFIGSYVKIGRNCIVGQRCVLKDCCELKDDTTLPSDSVVPPFTLYGGSPGIQKGNLTGATEELRKEESRSFYLLFTKRQELIK